MTPVRTLQRYKCDFCKYRVTKHRMTWHEPTCYMNPDRKCSECGGKSWIIEHENEEGYRRWCGPCKVANEIKERRGKVFLAKLRK